MKCLQEDCNKEIENKTGRRKFCSDACKMKHFRKHGKKNEVKPFQMQALYNQILDVVNRIGAGNGLPPTFTSVIEKPKKSFIVRSAEQWHELKRACESVEEWEKVREQIENAENLTSKQKQIIINTP